MLRLLSSTRLPALLLSSALVVACRGERTSLPAASTPLVELSTSARAIVETARIDLGDPADRGHLERGWGPDESGSEGSFAWSGGEEATLRFDVVEPRDTTVALRGWSYPLPAGAPQRVELRLNGVPIETLELSTAPATFRLEVAAERFVAGENRLSLVPSRWLERPGELAWATGWDLVRLHAEEAPQPPRFGGAGELILPARTALSWTLELPAGCWLAWDGVTRDGEAGLEIGVRQEGEPERTRRADGPGRIPLTGYEPGLVEVTLRSLGPSGALRLAGARLHRAPAPPVSPDPASPLAGARPNLVVYLIDTLRADHLGAYGYPLATSPAIDAFAREAVRWREMRAQAPWTKPAVATLLTGLYPPTHGAERRSRGLAPEVTTLAERLAAGGYQTAFFTTNPTVTAAFGFDRGFETYRYLSAPRGEGRKRKHVDSAAIHREVVAWLDRRDAARPFFLVVHTLDPHDPYTPPERFKRRFAPEVDTSVACCIRAHELAALTPEASRERARQMAALYDAEIAQNDESFGALVAELARRDLLDRSAVVLTSDHGEEFYDHGGWRHAMSLYEEVLRVPLVIRLPGGARAGTTLDAPADQVDLAPTLLALAGLPAPGDLPGESWLRALEGGAPPDAESLSWLEHPAFSLAGIVRDGWKGIRNSGGWRPPLERGPFELYDLRRDPREANDLAGAEPLRRHGLVGRLGAREARLGRTADAPEVAIDPELERSLRALGYF